MAGPGSTFPDLGPFLRWEVESGTIVNAAFSSTNVVMSGTPFSIRLDLSCSGPGCVVFGFIGPWTAEVYAQNVATGATFVVAGVPPFVWPACVGGCNNPIILGPFATGPAAGSQFPAGIYRLTVDIDPAPPADTAFGGFIDGLVIEVE
jgi:hypothetical protein